MMMKKIIAALCIMFVVVTTVSAAAAELYEVIERCDFVIDPGVEVGEEE